MTDVSVDLDEDQQIRSPTDLKAVLVAIRDAVAGGYLKEVAPLKPNVFDPIHLSDISPSGPWPDVFELFFKNRQGKLCKLGVETYHGHGGEWRVGIDD